MQICLFKLKWTTTTTNITLKLINIKSIKIYSAVAQSKYHVIHNKMKMSLMKKKHIHTHTWTRMIFYKKKVYKIESWNWNFGFTFVLLLVKLQWETIFHVITNVESGFITVAKCIRCNIL